MRAFPVGCLCHSLLKKNNRGERYMQKQQLSASASSKDTGNNELEGVGPLPLSIVSSKRTGGAIDGFIEGRQGGNREHVGPLPLSMVSSNGAGGAINGFIEGRQRGREQGTPHAQWDMRGISPAICRREGVASIYFFPNQIFFNWSIEMKGRVAVTQFSNAPAGKAKKKRGAPNK